MLKIEAELANTGSTRRQTSSVGHQRQRHEHREHAMSGHVCKMIEITGSWEKTIAEAIQTAIERADQTLRNMRWFEVVQTRG